ncbi:MAG: hypothetical protein AAF460_12525 [Pseudomonadota bacterium]
MRKNHHIATPYTPTHAPDASDTESTASRAEMSTPRPGGAPRDHDVDTAIQLSTSLRLQDFLHNKM